MLYLVSREVCHALNISAMCESCWCHVLVLTLPACFFFYDVTHVNIDTTDTCTNYMFWSPERFAMVYAYSSQTLLEDLFGTSCYTLPLTLLPSRLSPCDYLHSLDCTHRLSDCMQSCSTCCTHTHTPRTLRI